MCHTNWGKKQVPHVTNGTRGQDYARPLLTCHVTAKQRVQCIMQQQAWRRMVKLEWSRRCYSPFHTVMSLPLLRSWLYLVSHPTGVRAEMVWLSHARACRVVALQLFSAKGEGK